MQIHQSPLSPDNQAALEKYLNDPAFDILIEVLESGRFDVQVQASQARESDSDTVRAANAGLLDEQARAIERTVYMLTALRKQKEPFTTSTATPN